MVVQPPTGYLISNSTSFSGTLASSVDQFNGDFGVRFNGADVSGILFDDLDKDGTQTAGESPLQDLVVFADYNGDRVPSAGEPLDTTAADGSYLLTNVIAGETAITVVTTDTRIITSDVDPIPRLFVEYGQDVRELNPRDGAVVNYFNVSVSPAHGVELTGLAFDGTNLYAMNSSLNVVLVIDPDDGGSGSANILDTIDLNIQPNQSITGLAVIGTTLFALDEINDSILTYDLMTGTLGTVDFSGVYSGGNPSYESLDSIDGLIYRTRTFGQIEVLDSGGTQQDTFNVNFFSFGLGGGVDRDNAVEVTINGSQTNDGVSHTWTSTPATLQGNISGADGTDPIEVYLDVNGNRQLDLNEPSTTTDAGGDYQLDGIEPGDYQVRVNPPAGQMVHASAPDATSIFHDVYDSGVGTFYELDTLTGETAHSFSVPAINSGNIGLGVDGGNLFVTQNTTLYEVDPNSAQIVSQPQFSGNEFTGLAIIDSTLYLHDPSAGELASMDLLTRQWGTSLDLAALNPPLYYNSDFRGLGEAGNGQHLLTQLFDQPYLLDPQTGLLTFLDAGIASIGPVGGANGMWFDITENSGGSQRTIRFLDLDGLVSKEVVI